MHSQIVAISKDKNNKQFYFYYFEQSLITLDQILTFPNLLIDVGHLENPKGFVTLEILSQEPIKPVKNGPKPHIFFAGVRPEHGGDWPLWGVHLPQHRPARRFLSMYHQVRNLPRKIEPKVHLTG